MKPIGSKLKLGLVLMVIAAVAYLFISLLAPPLFSQAPVKHILKTANAGEVVQTMQVEVVPLFDAIMKLYDKALVSIGGTVSLIVLIRDKLKKPKEDKLEEVKRKKKSKFY